MVVVAIAGILAAVAIPAYSQYSLSSKTSEAKTNVGGIAVALDSFNSANDGYPGQGGFQGDGPATPGTQKAQWTLPDCPANCSPTSIANCSEFRCVGFAPTGPTYFAYEVDTDTEGFAVWAVGDLDGDGTQSTFALVTDKDDDDVADAITGVGGCATTAEATANHGNITDCIPGEF